MARSVQADDSWGERVAKLLPAEATAMFVTINGFVSSSNASLTTRSYVMMATLIVVTVCVPLFLRQIYKVDNFRQIALCTASFPLWAINISPRYIAEAFDFDANSLQLLASIATVFISALGPVFLPTDPASGNPPQARFGS